MTTMTTVDLPTPTPGGPGSASGVPGLPPGFTETFTSRFVDTGDLRLHAVTGGQGPPLLLVPGWPQTWYAWRLLMPSLAESFTVVALDPRGAGLSDKPDAGYDTATLATDLVAAMAALGHERFTMVGHDVGMWTGYALAADHPDRLDRLVLAEALVPGLAPSPDLLAPQAVVDRLWHFGFNRLAGLNEQLVRGRENLFFGHQFTSKAVVPLPHDAVKVYVDALASSAEALRASFGPYRALDATIAQNARRSEGRLKMPVLTLAGAQSTGELVGRTMSLVADDLQSLVLPDCGHFPAEEAPGAVLAALSAFLAPH